MEIEQLAKQMREKALADSKTIVITKEVWPERAKSIYFHAGRYVEGARDSVARRSYFEAMEQENEH